MRKPLVIVQALAVSTLLTSCNYEQPTKPQLNTQPLRSVTGAELERQLKSGLLQILKGDVITSYQQGIAHPYRPLYAASANSDEGDFRKANQTVFDGQYWFAATHYQNHFYEDAPSNGFLIASDKQPLTIEGRYRDTTTPEDFVFVEKMEEYSPERVQAGLPQLKNQILAGLPTISDAKFPSILEQPEIFTVINGYAPHEIDPPPTAPAPQVAMQGLFLLPASNQVATISTVSGNDTMLQFVNTANINEPALAWEVTIEGRAADAAQVNDSLIIVSERTLEEDGLFHLSGLTSSSAKAETDRHNNAILDQLEGQDLITRYSVDGVTAALTTDCMTQEPTDSKLGMQRLINVTAINPEERSLKSLCISGDYSVTGINANTVFLLGSIDGDAGSNTVIHALDLSTGTPVYKATVAVPSALTLHSKNERDPMNDQSQSRAHAARPVHITNSELRVLTIAPNKVVSLNRIPFGDGEFQQSVSIELTNPDESISSIFYANDKAFVFSDPPSAGTRRTLRSIDLATNQIVNEENFAGGYLTGSTYIVGERYLLTIRGGTETYYAELYDLLDERFSPLLRERINYQATTLRSKVVLTQGTEQSLRIAFSTRAYSSHSKVDAGSPSEGVQMLEITGLETGSPTITDAGFISIDGPRRGRYTPPLQIGMSGEVIIAQKESAFWRAKWGDNENLEAPVIPVPCERTPINGGRITLERVLSFGPNDLCESEVVLLDHVTDQRETLQPNLDESNTDKCVFEGAFDRYDSLVYEVTVPEIDDIFLASIRPKGSYCSPKQADVRLEIAPKAYCDQLTAPAFVMGIRTNDDDHAAACSASLVATYVDNDNTYKADAIPAEELPERYKNMLSGDVKCALLGPDVIPPSYRGTDVDLAVTVDGYEAILASTKVTQNGQCLPKVVAFEATATPL